MALIKLKQHKKYFEPSVLINLALASLLQMRYCFILVLCDARYVTSLNCNTTYLCIY